MLDQFKVLIACPPWPPCQVGSPLGTPQPRRVQDSWQGGQDSWQGQGGQDSWQGGQASGEDRQWSREQGRGGTEGMELTLWTLSVAYT